MKWLLSSLIFLPLLGALVSMVLPKREKGLHRAIGIVFSVLTFLLSLVLLKDGGQQLSAHSVDWVWIASLDIHYKLSVDGLSLWLVVLTTFLMPLVFWFAQGSIEHRLREFVVSMLVLETGILGSFFAMDLFLFYLFWEVMLIPMYLIIGIWGGSRRLYASIKFVLYTALGSLMMLAAVLFLYFQARKAGLAAPTSIDTIRQLSLSSGEQLFCFLAFALAFCIKVPLFPLHTWLPDAHVEAPTAGSVLLAGVLLKLGIYGLMRFAIPMFPTAAALCAPWISALAVVGIVYGSLVALAQTDIKKLIAYSSVAHMGLIVLGVMMMNQTAWSGAIYQMLAHGISTGGLFLCVGVLYDRRHTRDIKDYGGVWKRMPLFGALFLIFTMASIGLPGLCGFIGEFSILLGTWSAPEVFAKTSTLFSSARLLAVLATTGVVLSAVYMLTLFQKVMLGPIKHPENQQLHDVNWREKGVLIPLVLAAFALGLLPTVFFRPMRDAVQETLAPIQQRIESSTGKMQRKEPPFRMRNVPALPQQGAPSL